MEHTLEIIGTVVGILYLWLEYRASIYLWIAGIIMPAVYIFVYYDAGLYADFGINIYYLGAAIYGWMMWKYGASCGGKVQDRKERTQEQKNKNWNFLSPICRRATCCRLPPYSSPLCLALPGY